MLLLDAIIRYSAIALLLLFAVLAIRDGRGYSRLFYGALLCISCMLLLLHTAPQELALPSPLFEICLMLSVADIAFLWWFGRSLFEDDFRLGWLEWLGFIVLSAPVLLFRVNKFFPMDGFNYQAVDLFKSIVSLLAILHIVYVALRGRGDDLIEKRRRFRFYFVIAMSLVGAVTIIGEEVFYNDYQANYDTFRAALILPMAAWGLLWLTHMRPEALAFAPLKEIAPAIPQIDPRDRSLHSALLNAMEHDKIYIRPSLTIGGLAGQLDSPEHHLRRLINQGMGYRNFSAFLNHYRVKSVQVDMANPAHYRTPILTLAMDVGYNSLAPFNRAFKAETGQTPSDYRRDLLAKIDKASADQN